jgi:hypothetical protein
VEFEERIALVVERLCGIREVARQMPAQLPALLLDSLGFRNGFDLNHIAAFSRRARHLDATPQCGSDKLHCLEMSIGTYIHIFNVVIFKLISGGQPRIAGECWRCSLGGCVPHQPRVESLGRQHGQDHDGAKRYGTDPGLDRDHRAEDDERAEQ